MWSGHNKDASLETLASLASSWITACYTSTGNEISQRVHEQETGRDIIDIHLDIRSNYEVDSRKADVPLDY